MNLDDQSKRDEYGETGEPLPAGLYLVATPIGASQDITLRALDALRRADVIAAEDTRRAQKLMSIHGVPRAGRPLIPYHDHSGDGARGGLVKRIAEGRSVVVVSDAGTPLIADPGWKLAREAIDQHLPVIALPGASALWRRFVSLAYRRIAFCSVDFQRQNRRPDGLSLPNWPR